MKKLFLIMKNLFKSASVAGESVKFIFMSPENSENKEKTRYGTPEGEQEKDHKKTTRELHELANIEVANADTLDLPDVDSIKLPDFCTEQERDNLKEYYNYELSIIKEMQRQLQYWQAKCKEREGFSVFQEAANGKINELINDFKEGVVDISQDTTKFFVNEMGNRWEKGPDGHFNFNITPATVQVDRKLDTLLYQLVKEKKINSDFRTSAEKDAHIKEIYNPLQK